MIGKIIHLCLCLFTTNTLAFPGYTTAGTHFVVAFPVSRQKLTAFDNRPYEAFVYFETDEQHATVTVTAPSFIYTDGYYNDGVTDTKYKLSNHNTARHSIRLYYYLPEKPGTYRSVAITSTGNIRVFARFSYGTYLQSFSDGLHQEMDAFRLLPKQSCGQHYYIVTTHEYLFLIVQSFDPPSTTFQVELFSESGSKFSYDDCMVHNIDCTSSRSLEGTLKKHESWIYTAYSDITNSQITSNNPIQVITGSSLCRTPVDSYQSSDEILCMAVMRPTESWGKEYVVPYFRPWRRNPIKYLKFNSKRFPLNVTIYARSELPKQLTIARPSEAYVSEDTDNITVFKSKVSFGLSVIFSASANSNSFLMLTPVEQWMHGVNFKYPAIHSVEMLAKLIIVTRKTTKSEVEMTDSHGINVSWLDEIKLNRINYNFGLAYISGKDEVSLRLHIKNPDGTMMLYVQGYTEYFYSVPYDFYLGKIYEQGCDDTDVENVVASDGVDNDCDGFVDEEVKNRKDDDGDGQIDEDYVEELQDGEWTEWSYDFNVMCHSNPTHISTRACVGRSRLGKYCEGRAIRCNNGTLCPLFCYIRRRYGRQCFSKYCEICVGNFFRCDSCQAGYAPTLYCTTPCPPGWDGPGCMNVNTATMYLDSNLHISGKAKNAGVHDKPTLTANDVDFLAMYVSGFLLTALISGCLVYVLFIQSTFNGDYGESLFDGEKDNGQ